MIRYRLNPIIFLINNGGYTIEVEIHDGPYNNIQNWDYSGLVQCFDNHQGNVFSTKVGPHSHRGMVTLIALCVLCKLKPFGMIEKKLAVILSFPGIFFTMHAYLIV